MSASARWHALQPIHKCLSPANPDVCQAELLKSRGFHRLQLGVVIHLRSCGAHAAAGPHGSSICAPSSDLARLGWAPNAVILLLKPLLAPLLPGRQPCCCQLAVAVLRDAQLWSQLLPSFAQHLPLWQTLTGHRGKRAEPYGLGQIRARCM